MAQQNGKWPIPKVDKPHSYSIKASNSGSGVPGANKHATVGSMNISKAAQVKAKQ